MPDAKYRILEELGAGGMGKVYRGLLIGREGFQRPIVIKQVRRGSDAQQVKLFVEEARRYAVLDHENIGRIFDFEEVDEQLCIILELIDGWSLVDYIAQHHEQGRLPDEELSVFIVSRVCRALQYVFERANIVHRDVSPGNIMITREGTVKLIDFGIATASGTRDHGLTGKPAYMAPEMVVELRADHKSDLFGLGSVLWELLTGERLFTGRNTAVVLERVISAEIPDVREKNAEVPDEVVAILERALKRDPAHRFGSAARMGEACEHHLYDKGYGPTNLTMKQYLGALMPDAADPEGAADRLEHFGVVQHTMIPIDDGRGGPTAPADITRVAPPLPGERPEPGGDEPGSA
jgi:serine/threonine-protein kinase